MSKFARLLIAGLCLLLLASAWVWHLFATSPYFSAKHAATVQQDSQPITPEAKSGAPAEKNTTTGVYEQPQHNAVEGGGSFVLLTAPVWQFSDNFGSHVTALVTAASEGDINALYVLGMNLQFCYYAPSTPKQLDEALQQASSFSDVSAATARIEHRYAYCEGTHHQMNKGYYDYLDEAADKGHVFAQHAISRLTVDRYMDAQGFTSLPRDDFIEKRDAFVARQRAFLEQAVAQGSFPAMKRLAGLHHAQKTGSGGYVNAFALNHVILTLTDDNELYNRYNWLQQRLQQTLSDDELTRGYAKAETWLHRIRSNGTLVTDEN